MRGTQNIPKSALECIFEVQKHVQTSNTKFLKSKKKNFQKFGGQKKCKITFLGCGTKKRFRVKILIDYIYPIDEIWHHLEYGNILEKSILRLSCTFWAFFQGSRVEKHLWDQCQSCAIIPKIFSKKTYDVGAYLRKKISAARPNLAEIS